MSRQEMVRSNWRGEINELLGAASGSDGYGDLTKKKPRTDTKARKEITGMPPGETNIVVINPTVVEAFSEIGAVVLEFHEEAVVEELSKEDIEELQRKKDAKEGKKPGKVDEGYEDEKKVEVITALKKKKPEFKKRYGKDAPDVMYAVADKTAKKKGNTSKSDDRYAYEEVVHCE